MTSKFDFRSTEQELMDDLDSDGPVIEQTLRELETINQWLGGNRVTLNAISKLISSYPSQKHWRIVDIGCGGGDMLKLVWRWAQKKGIQIELIGVDANPNVIAYAQKNTAEFKDIRFKAINIFSEAFAQLKADIITATLFTHHFSDEELVSLFIRLKQQAQVGLAINDLHRHWFAYHSINLLTRFFSRSPMVKNDAGVSVLRSFSKRELASILNRAQLPEFEMRWFWAFRWQVIVYSGKFQ